MVTTISTSPALRCAAQGVLNQVADHLHETTLVLR